MKAHSASEPRLRRKNPMTESSYRVGTLVDVRSGELLRDRVIVVNDGRVVAIEPAGAHATKDTVDLGDYLVAPGLIDLHTHLVGSLDHGGYGPFLSGSPAKLALDGVRNAAVTIRAGFTTVRDLGTFRAFVDCELRDAINEGIVPGPRMFVAGGYVTSSTGGGELTGLAHDIRLPEDYRVGVADSPSEVRRAVRRLVHGGADLIKVIATGAGLAAGTVQGAPEFSEEELSAAVREAALYGKHVAAHAHSDLGALWAIRAGVRTIEHGSQLESEEVFDAMIEHDTFYVPTTYLIHWLDDQGEASGFPPEVRAKLRRDVDSSREALRTAVSRGVQIGYGTDAIVYPHGDNAKQMVDFAEAGMAPIDVLRSATIVAAEAIGSTDVGLLEPGRFADFVAVKGKRELDDVRMFGCIDVVVKGGCVIE
jgi:imidazolonepropionase-like amidohydrolase